MSKILYKLKRYLQRLLASQRRPYMEYAPTGWTAQTSPRRGWNNETIAEAEASKFQRFKDFVASHRPLGFSHESRELAATDNLLHHNLHLTFAYALALAARNKNQLKILDWGGGLGHYFLLAKALLPGTELDFACREVPVMCAAGRTLNPEVQFFETDECLKEKYDFVLINGSLQYFPDWQEMLPKIATACSGWLMLARLPVAESGQPYVVWQRMQKYGYDTELLMQIFDENAVLRLLANHGWRVFREFVVDEWSRPHNAPSRFRQKSWLLKNPVDGGD